MFADKDDKLNVGAWKSEPNWYQLAILDRHRGRYPFRWETVEKMPMLLINYGSDFYSFYQVSGSSTNVGVFEVSGEIERALLSANVHFKDRFCKEGTVRISFSRIRNTKYLEKILDFITPNGCKITPE